MPRFWGGAIFLATVSLFAAAARHAPSTPASPFRETLVGSAQPSGSRWSPDSPDPATTLLPDVAGMMNKIGGAFPSRYGGGWIERPSSTTARLHVTLVNATDTDRQSVMKMTSNNPNVVVDSGNYTLGSLETYKQAIGTCLESAPTKDASVDADETRNLVVVQTLASTTSLQACARASNVPDSAWTIDSNSGRGQLTDNSYTYPPYEGGLYTDIIDYATHGIGPCTTGWTLKTSIGNYKASTEGHCEPDSVAHMYVCLSDACDLGDGALNSYLGQTRTNSDAVRYSIPAANASNQVNWETSHVFVIYQWQLSDGAGNYLPPVGTLLCWQGRTTGAVCDSVAKTNMGIYDGAVWHDYSWKVYTASHGGDSGSPVWSVVNNNPCCTVRAAGTLWGSDTTTPGYMLMQHISWVTRDLQASVYTGS